MPPVDEVGALAMTGFYPLIKNGIIERASRSGVMNRFEKCDLGIWRTQHKVLNIRSLEMVTSCHKCAHPECDRILLTDAAYCRNHNPPPTYIVSNGMVRVALAKGVIALIDEVDKEEITPLHWYCNNDGYAVRQVQLGKIMGKPIIEIAYMHRVIMETVLNRCLSPLEVIDHMNGDTLDNRRSNLRLSTGVQNRHNSAKRSDRATSQYKGVSWHKYERKWQARITVKKRVISLGYFNSETEAALAYNKGAQEYFGAFARLNEIEGGGTLW